MKVGTAAYVIPIRRAGPWQILEYGGTYMIVGVAIDSFHMEAVGLELLMGATTKYLVS